MPEWSTCVFNDSEVPDLWWDPPIALKPQSTIAIPTVPSAYSATTTAAPGSTQPSAVQETTAMSSLMSSLSSPPVPAPRPTTATIAASSSRETASPSTEPQLSSRPSSGDTASYQQPPDTRTNLSDDPSQQETSQDPSSYDPTNPASTVSSPPETTAQTTAIAFSYQPETSDDASSSGPATTVPQRMTSEDPASEIASLLGHTTKRPAATTPLDPASEIASLLGASSHVLATPDETDPVVDSSDQPTPATANYNSPIAVFSTDGQKFTAQQTGSAVLLGSVTLSPGQVTTISGQQVSLGASALVLGSSTMALTAPNPTYLPPKQATQAVTLGTDVEPATYLSLGSGAVAVGGTTLSVGGPAVTLGTHVLSAALSAIVLDGTSGGASSTIVFSAPDPPLTIASGQETQAITVGSQAETATYLSSGAFAIAGTTVSVGGPIMSIGTHVLSAAPSGIVLDGSSTILESAASSDPDVTDLTIGSQVLTVSTITGTANAVQIGSMTLSEGGPAATILGHQFSEASDGLMMIGTSIVSVPGTPTVHTEVSFTLGSQVMYAVAATGPNPGFSVDGTTLYSGGPALVVDGDTISAGATGLMVDDSSIVSPVEATPAPVGAIFTVGGQVMHAMSATGANPGISIDGTTLRPGSPALVVGRYTLSDKAGKLVIDGTSTVSLSDVAMTSFHDLTVTVGGQVTEAVQLTGFTPEVSIDRTTLYAGGPALQTNGHTISEGTGGALVIDGSSMIPMTTSGTALGITASGSQTSASGTTQFNLAPTSTSASDAGVNGRRKACRALVAVSFSALVLLW